MVKFPRDQVIQLLQKSTGDITLMVTGIIDELAFMGEDTIRLIHQEQQSRREREQGKSSGRARERAPGQLRKVGWIPLGQNEDRIPPGQQRKAEDRILPGQQEVKDPQGQDKNQDRAQLAQEEAEQQAASPEQTKEQEELPLGQRKKEAEQRAQGKLSSKKIRPRLTRKG